MLAMLEKAGPPPVADRLPEPHQTPAPGGQDRVRVPSGNLMDVSRLAGHVVTILGVGSVGGRIAADLAPARLKLNLLDFKTVQPKHTREGRTIYRAYQVGKKKVYAAKEMLERDYPGTVINPFPYNLLEVPQIELRRMMAASLVVALAIDDPAGILDINDIGYELVELVKPGVHIEARSGHIAFSLPHVTPCLRCTLDITNASDLHRLDAEPGSSWHIQRVAHEAAAIVLELAYAKVTGRAVTGFDLGKNLIYIANTRENLSPDGPGIRFEASRRRPGCPICNR
jgi:molybdopterin/thiamine biosynthesis adenylyltransferase